MIKNGIKKWKEKNRLTRIILNLKFPEILLIKFILIKRIVEMKNLLIVKCSLDFL